MKLNKFQQFQFSYLNSFSILTSILNPVSWVWMASVHSIADKQEIAFLLYLKSIIVFFWKSCSFLLLSLLIPDTLKSFCHCVFWTNMLPAHRGSAGCYYWMHCLVLNTFIFLLLISSIRNSFCSPLWFYLLQILPFKFHYKASATFAVAFSENLK